MKDEEKISFKQKYLLFIYKFWAEKYDSYVEPRWHFDRKIPIEKLGISSGNRILEIGVGTGLNLPFYPKNCEVTGIDFSQNMLEKAKEKKSAAKVILKKEDARHTSFPDDFFDKALATYVIRVSPEPQKIFREASRIIKKNGLFCIVDRFKEKGGFFLKLHGVILSIFGGGKDYQLEELIADTPWKVIFNISFGSRKNTRLIILKNEK